MDINDLKNMDSLMTPRRAKLILAERERRAKARIIAVDKKIADLTDRLSTVESRHEDACATDDGELADMLEHLSAYIEQEIADLTAGQ